MTPREIIANVRVKMTGFATGSIGLPFADEAIDALHSAGYRIIGPGELDPETVEKCAIELEANWGHICTPEMRDAIRALAKEKQGC